MGKTNEHKNKRLNVEEIYNFFKNNRCHSVELIGSNNDLLKLSNDNKYILANKPSKVITNTEWMGTINIKDKYSGNQKLYPIYKNYSYAYTESVSISDDETYIWSMDYIYRSQMVDTNWHFFIPNFKVIHERSLDDYQYSYVNEKTHVTYLFVNNDDSSKNCEFDFNENNPNHFTRAKLTEILSDGGEITCGKLNLYFDYDYLKPTDYYIYNDGHYNTGMNAYLWDMKDVKDETQHLYGQNDNEKVNPKVEIKCHNDLKWVFDTRGKDMFKYAGISLENKTWNAQTSTENGKFYIKENDLTFTDFYGACHLDNSDSNWNESLVNTPFSTLVQRPALRNNSSSGLFYINIKGGQQTNDAFFNSADSGQSRNIIKNSTNGTQYYVANIWQTNYNERKFIKKIGGLPFHIINNTFKLYIDVSLTDDRSGLGYSGISSPSFEHHWTITIHANNNLLIKLIAKFVFKIDTANDNTIKLMSQNGKYLNISVDEKAEYITIPNNPLNDDDSNENKINFNYAFNVDLSSAENNSSQLLDNIKFDITINTNEHIYVIPSDSITATTTPNYNASINMWCNNGGSFYNIKNQNALFSENLSGGLNSITIGFTGNMHYKQNIN